MSASDLAWLKYPAATITLIVFFLLLGLPAMAIARRRLPSWGYLLTPVLGMAWGIVLVSWYARLGEALETWLVYGVLLLAVAAFGIWAVRSGALASARSAYEGPRATTATAMGLAGPWLVGVGLVTLFMLPMITSEFQQPGFLTVFTFGNADIGSYVGEATNVAKAGFANAGYYVDWNPGSDPSTLSADVDHTGANALLALCSVIFSSEVWKIGQVTIMLSTAAMVASGVALVRALVPGRPRTALVIGTLGTTTFMVWYLVGNFFLGQIVCLALILAQLTIFIVARNHLLDWRVLVTIAPLAAATWLASPELQLVLFLLAGALILADFAASLATRTPGAVRRLVMQSVGVGTAIIVAGLTVFPFMADNIARSQRVYDDAGQVGWTLDLQNGVLMFLGYPATIGTRSGLGWVAIAAVSLLLLGVFAWALWRRDRLGILAGVFGLVLIGGAAFGAQRWGWGVYQSWKLTLTLSIPFIILAGILLLRPWNDANRRVVLVVFAFIIASNVVVGTRMWDTTRVDAAAMRQYSVGSELVTFLADGRVQEQERLNMYLPSLYHTMIAPSIYQGRAAMSSPTYFYGAQPGIRPYACSLVDEKLYEKKMGTVAYQRLGYLLVNTPRCL